MTIGVADIEIKRVVDNVRNDVKDTLAIEEPLEIKLSYFDGRAYCTKNLSITMRTPGNDEELAVGFLFTEGIIRNSDEVRSCVSLGENRVLVTLEEQVTFDITKLERNFYTTSSCGVCGKSSIDAVKTVCLLEDEEGDISISASILHSLPDKLSHNQGLFEQTGGIHASALFDSNGDLLLTREDIGRHNALDKLIGTALQNNDLPLGKHILLLSGRASFELIQKAAMAGVKIIAAVGAPSSLAVATAKEFDMTLVGFLKADRFNIYCGDNRVIV